MSEIPLGRGQALDLEQQLAGLVGEIARIAHVDGAADHHADELVGRDVGRADAVDAAAVAQHRDAVAEREHLGHAVRDVDDGDAVGLQPRDQREQQLGLAVGQRRGRLVHHQDARVLADGLGDLDHLLLGDAERVDDDGRIDVEADRVEQAFCVGQDLAAVDGAGNAALRLAAEKDVLRDVEIGDEREFLEDHGNAEFLRVRGRGDRDLLALVEELAGVGLVGAAQHLHQARLAGAVLAEQHVDFAGVERKGHVVQRLDAGKLLADAAQLEQRRR